MATEKIESDWANAKYKEGEWVRFRYNEVVSYGKIKYYINGFYGVAVPCGDTEIIYNAQEEDIMEEQAPYGNKSGIGEGKPKYKPHETVMFQYEGQLDEGEILIISHSENGLLYTIQSHTYDEPLTVNEQAIESRLSIRTEDMVERNVQSFKEITEQMTDTYRRKNTDYGNSFIQSIHKYGFIAALTRMSDKFNRIENLILNDKREVEDESLGDSLLDLANYSIMTYMEFKNWKECRNYECQCKRDAENIPF